MNFLRSNPIVLVLALLCVLFVYGLYGGHERPDPAMTADAINHLKMDFESFSFASRYSNREQLANAVTKFRVPGAGYGVNGKISNARGFDFCIYEISIPQQSEDMIIVYRYHNPPEDGFDYIDHFILESKPEDELLKPRRVISLDEKSIRFLSDGREYKSHELRHDPNSIDNDG